MYKTLNRKKANFAKLKGLNSLNVPAKASLMYTAANIFSRACALVFTPLFTRIMPVGEYGELSLFQAYLTILSAISTLEIGGGVIIRAYGRFKGESERVLLSAFSLTLISSTLVFAVLIAVNPDGARLFSGELPMLYISVIGGAAVNFFSARSKYFYKTHVYLLLTVINSLFTSLISLGALYMRADGSNTAAIRAAVSSAVIGVCAASVIIYTFFLSRKKTDAKSSLIGITKYILTLALPMLPYYASVMSISQTNKLLVESYLGKSALGKYSVAYSAALALTVVGSGLSQVLNTWLVRRGGDTARAKRVASLSQILLSLSICAYLAIAPELFAFIAPREYSDALICMYPMTVSVLPTFLLGICTSYSLLGENRIAPAVSGAISALINYLLLRVLVPRYGILAASAVYLISYVLLTALFIIALRISGVKAPVGLGYILSLLLCALSAALEYRLRAYILPRLLFAAVLAASALLILYKNRRMIFENKNA